MDNLNTDGLSKTVRWKRWHIYAVSSGVLVLVLAVGVAVVRTNLNSFKKVAGPPAAPLIKKTEIKYPEYFPQSILSEKDVKIMESGLQNVGAGKEQFTVKYITKRNLDDNYRLFSEYFSMSQWFHTTTKRGTEDVFLSAYQGQNFASIWIAKNPVTDDMVVTISVIPNMPYQEPIVLNHTVSAPIKTK